MSQNTDITVHSGVVSSKVLINKATQTDQDSTHLAENELHSIHLCDYECDVSKLVSRLQDIAGILEATR